MAIQIFMDGDSGTLAEFRKNEIRARSPLPFALASVEAVAKRHIEPFLLHGGAEFDRKSVQHKRGLA
ncbi:MAG: hypothetical protein WBW81_04095 [Methylocella sp.]